MIETEIARRRLRREEPRATVVVQGIDHNSRALGATVSLDWVALFHGDHPRTGRQLRDPGLWNSRLWVEMEAAERGLRELGFNRVVLDGPMRLPAWFAVGAVFADTCGMRVECQQGGARWATDTPLGDIPVDVSPPIDLGGGAELAVAVSVTNDVLPDVLTYLRGAELPVGRFMHIAVSPKPSRTAIPDAACAMGLALEVRKRVREHVRETGATKVHLFLSGPAGVALFLGHVWNRLPPTQIYEDLSPGYSPAFLIPG